MNKRARWRGSRTGRAVPISTACGGAASRSKVQRRRLRTPRLFAEPPAEPVEGSGEGRRHLGAVADRLGEADALPPGDRKALRRQRLKGAAERPVEAAEEGATKAAGEGRARQRIKIADPPQAEADKVGRDAGVETEGFDRKRRNSRRRLPLGKDGSGGSPAGEGAGGAGGRRQRGADAETKGAEPGLDLGDQRRLTAEQMGASR